MVVYPVRNILFLARFAPDNPNSTPTFDAEWGSSPIYHHRLYHALAATGANVIAAREPSVLFERRQEVDFVYTIYNRARFRNSEIFVSSLCGYLRLPYLGGHPNTRAIAEDKHLFKLLARRLEIPTPDWTKIDPWDSLEMLDRLELPCIVKWRFGADSAGITPKSVAHDRESLRNLVFQAQKSETPVIVEEFVPGENLTTGAIGAQTCEIFQTVRISTDLEGDIQTYDQKKFGTGKRVKTIYDNEAVTIRIDAIITKLHNELRPLDYFRCDFRYNSTTNELFILELNAICNLHEESTFALSASKFHSQYNDLVHHILSESLDRQGLSLE